MAVSSIDAFDALTAGADLSAKLFYAVKIASDGDLELAGDGELAVGLITEADTAGNKVTYQYQGIARGYAGGSITAGTKVAANASGQLVTATTGENVIGIAREAATASGQIISVLLSPGGGVAA